MTLTLRSADLGKMTPEEREYALDVALADSPESASVYRSIVRARLRVFEERYELPSSDLHAALKNKRLTDTKDIAQWLIWLSVWYAIGKSART